MSTAKSNAPEYSVGELSGAIKRALESEFGYVRLRGEISGFRGQHSSGHCYFALKDDRAKIEAVIWRGVYSKLKVKPEEGMEIVAQGRITTYPGSSKYQIVIEGLEPAGVGALMALLEERKRKLAAEGLFAPERKRALPFLPRVVGVVTSPTGAVIRDMLHGFEERFPARVIVWPVRVQGETAAPEVAAAIRGFSNLAPSGPFPRPDVLIVARGGGSLEDLWGFNEEAVVRAVAESSIPVISAVGHETDWTLIDLVADARAPTPTKAAEWAVPKYSDLLEQLRDLGGRLSVATRRSLEGARTNLRAAERGLPRAGDILAVPRQRFDEADRRLGKALRANTQAHGLRYVRIGARLSPHLLGQRLESARDRLVNLELAGRQGLSRLSAQKRTQFERTSGRLQVRVARQRLAFVRERLTTLRVRGNQAFSNRLTAARVRLEGNEKLLASLSYHGVLQRGFAVVRDDSGAAIRSQSAVLPGDNLEVQFADGRVDVTAAGEGRGGREKTGAKKQGKRLSPAGKKASKTGGAGEPGQGSLF